MAVAVFLILQIFRRPAPLVDFGLAIGLLINLIFLSIVLYWSITLLRARYRVDRNGVVVYWGSSRLYVPMQRIVDIIPAAGVEELKSQFSNGPAWLGGTSTKVRALQDKVTYFRATGRLEDSLVVSTGSHWYVLSPNNHQQFIQAWRSRRPLGSTQLWREREIRTGLPGLPIWSDAIAWGLVGGAWVTHLAVDGYVALMYDKLPQALSLHFDAYGRPDRIGSRSEILRLPLIALTMLVLDMALGFIVYRQHRVASYLIWAGGLTLQLLIWGALFTITG